MAVKGKKSKSPLLKLKHQGLFTVGEAEKIGISRLQLYRLAQKDKIIKVGPGLFQHPDLNLQGEELDYAIATRSVGNSAVIGGLTALFHYRLTNEAPQQVWLLVPPSLRPRTLRYRCIRTTTSLKAEIEDHKVYRIVTLERALIEALRYSTKIGLEVALSATRKALNQKMTTINKLDTAAKKLKLTPFLLKYWEAIIA